MGSIGGGDGVVGVWDESKWLLGIPRVQCQLR